jgi:hypothetical protein
MRANLFKGGVLAATLALCVAAVPWTVNVGTTPNDGTGDPARTAFNKINSNFVYVGTNLWSPTNGAGYRQWRWPEPSPGKHEREHMV